MKRFIKISLLFILFSCTSNKEVFWCGDHACVNKAEKQEYFKKNMIVEVRKIGNKNEQKSSKFNEIIKQGKLQKKELLKRENKKIKLSRKEQRQKIKDEKKLARQLLKQKRQRIKDEKKITRELKKRNKNKEISKKIDITQKDKKPVKNAESISKIDIESIEKIKKNDYSKTLKFNDFVKRIVEKSNIKSFPNINVPLE